MYRRSENRSGPVQVRAHTGGPAASSDRIKLYTILPEVLETHLCPSSLEAWTPLCIAKLKVPLTCPAQGHASIWTFSIWGPPVPRLLAPSEASSLSTTCQGQAALLQQLLSVFLPKQAFEHTAHPALPTSTLSSIIPTAITGPEYLVIKAGQRLLRGRLVSEWPGMRSKRS